MFFIQQMQLQRTIPHQSQQRGSKYWSAAKADNRTLLQKI
jgi:hypothetical protein